MNEQLEKLFEAPSYVKGAVVASAVAVVCGLYYLSIYSSIGEELVTAQGEVEKLNVEVTQKLGIANNLAKFEAEVERLDVELKRALAELPDKKEIPQLLERISDKARDAGLLVNVFKPQQPQNKNFYAELPIQIEVEGGYHQVATFFDEVGHLERIVNLDQVSMLAPKKGDAGNIIKTSVVATSFRFLDESERPKDEGGSANKRRRKKGGAAKKGGAEE